MAQHLIDRICRHAYSLALFLTVLTFSLVPLHYLATERGNVTRVVDGTTIEVSAGALPSLQVGDTAQIYRFNPGWLREIGFAEVVGARGDQVVLRYDPATFAWPMGLQGSVVSAESNGDLVLNIGTNNGVGNGAVLNLFDGRKVVGRVRVTSASADTARAEIQNLRNPQDGGSSFAIGHQVSGFNIPNQVTALAFPWMAGLEFFAIALMAALWLWTVVSPVPGEALERFGMGLRARIAGASPLVRRFALAALGVPVALVGIQIAAWFWIGFPQAFWADIRALHDFLPFLPTDQLRPQLGLPTQLRELPPVIATVALFAWLSLTFGTDKNPLTILLNTIRFRGEKSPIYWLFGWMDRGGLNWALHLVVFYLFGRNLLGFLKANMAAAANVGWARHQLPMTTWGEWTQSVLFMLTTWPDMQHWMNWFEAARYMTWSACIAGCMIGYGHTMLSILWKKDAIRWVDFTMTGWLVNLSCYGAYSAAAYNVFPHVSGSDPTVTAGPLLYLIPFTELFLNIAYTLSIFNMGTKFGVMVDKGLVDKGFYSVVRHPSYALEPLMFLTLYLTRVNSGTALLAMLAHPFLYWWRAERDDHFMGEANPDYVEYRKRVKYKYIPGLW